VRYRLGLTRATVATLLGSGGLDVIEQTGTGHEMTGHSGRQVHSRQTSVDVEKAPFWQDNAWANITE
jgi:hypothetical protein